MGVFVFFTFMMNKRLPERRERSSELGLNPVNLKSLGTFRKTYLGSHDRNILIKKKAVVWIIDHDTMQSRFNLWSSLL